MGCTVSGVGSEVYLREKRVRRGEQSEWRVRKEREIERKTSNRQCSMLECWCLNTNDNNNNNTFPYTPGKVR